MSTMENEGEQVTPQGQNKDIAVSVCGHAMEEPVIDHAIGERIIIKGFGSTRFDIKHKELSDAILEAKRKHQDFAETRYRTKFDLTSEETDFERSVPEGEKQSKCVIIGYVLPDPGLDMYIPRRGQDIRDCVVGINKPDDCFSGDILRSAAYVVTEAKSQTKLELWGLLYPDATKNHQGLGWAYPLDQDQVFYRHEFRCSSAGDDKSNQEETGDIRDDAAMSSGVTQTNNPALTVAPWLARPDPKMTIYDQVQGQIPDFGGHPLLFDKIPIGALEAIVGLANDPYTLKQAQECINTLRILRLGPDLFPDESLTPEHVKRLKDLLDQSHLQSVVKFENLGLFLRLGSKKIERMGEDVTCDQNFLKELLKDVEDIVTRLRPTSEPLTIPGSNMRETFGAVRDQIRQVVDHNTAHRNTATITYNTPEAANARISEIYANLAQSSTMDDVILAGSQIAAVMRDLHLSQTQASWQSLEEKLQKIEALRFDTDEENGTDED